MPNWWEKQTTQRIRDLYHYSDQINSKKPRSRDRGLLTQDERGSLAIAGADILISPGIIWVDLEEPEFYGRAKYKARCVECGRRIEVGDPEGCLRNDPLDDNDRSVYVCEKHYRIKKEMGRAAIFGKQLDEYRVVIAPPGPKRTVSHDERITKALALMMTVGRDYFSILDFNGATTFWSMKEPDDCDNCHNRIHKGQRAKTLLVHPQMSRRMYWDDRCSAALNEAPLFSTESYA